MPDFASNLEVYYRLDDASGSAAADSSGHARGGTLVNTPAWGTGQIGGALGFVAASSQRITMPNLAAVLGDNATFACWIKLAAATPGIDSKTGLASLGAVIGVNATHYPYTDGLGYFGLFRATSDTGSSRVDAVTLPAVTRTNWHHLCITTSPGANNWILYINGSSVTTATGITGVYYDADLWALGVSDNGAAQFYLDGSLDEVRIYSRALSPTDVAALYAFTGGTVIRSQMSGGIRELVGGMTG